MFKNYTKRRITLLCTIAVLAVIFIIQQILLSVSPIEHFKLKETPDTITITTSDFITNVYREDEDKYFTGTKKYIASSYIAEDLFESIKDITVLSKLTSSTSEVDNERYGFTPTNEITVEAFKDGKLLRTVKIGKISSSKNQTYIRLDDSNDTLLAASRTRDMFNLKEDAIRSKEIFINDTEKIQSVTVQTKGSSFKAERSQEGIWNIDGKGESSKILSWIESIKDIDAERWAEDETEFTEAKNKNVVTFVCTDKTIELQIAELNGDDECLCKSSTSPYCFYLTSTTAKRLLKEAKDLN